ncbi:unnamed protein product [Symbiodinium sp. KB8]|nr:unnamed protein product [Symbiodinium sp. KB8]
MGFGLGAVGGPLKEVACPPLTSGEAVMVRRVAGAEAGHARARSGSGPALPSTVTVRCAEILTADGYDLPSRSLSPTTLSALQEPGAAYAVNQDIGLAFLPMPSGREPGAAAVAAAASGSVPVLSNVDIEFDDPTSLAYMVGDAQ